MISPEVLLTNLASERPLFHSEADFQHAFAWLLHRSHPELWVRLELPIRLDGSAIHLDLLATSRDGGMAVELKYKTRALAATISGEQFRLADQAAQDLGRYDFLKDVHRLERFVDERSAFVGYAILLTNDSAYWTHRRDPNPVDAAFRLDPERTLDGTLAWDARASAGTTRSRETPLTLRGTYTVAWRDYSQIGSPRYGPFRYLAITVHRRAGG